MEILDIFPGLRKHLDTLAEDWCYDGLPILENDKEFAELHNERVEFMGDGKAVTLR